MKEVIKQRIEASVDIKNRLAEDDGIINSIREIVGEICKAIRAGNKVMFCGNGGSAADAQHLSAELSGRFYLDREPLYSEALHVNTSFLTAVANDYNYEEVYSRLVKAKGREGDVLVALSTSGTSSNILKALETARQIGVVTIGLTGEGGGQMESACKFTIKVPSSDTPRIQECHMLLGHIICEFVEKEFA